MLYRQKKYHNVEHWFIFSGMGEMIKVMSEKNPVPEVYVESDPNYINVCFQKELNQNINSCLCVVTLW